MDENKKHIFSSLLQNAADSIRLGVEDFESGGAARLISSARNLHAGVLLVYKEKLRRLSPASSEEVLLKQRIIPSMDAGGNLRFKGEGNKTVDIQEIKNRFKSLEITIDNSRLDRITKIRNEIEHYYTKSENDAVREIVSDSFILFRDFVRIQLNEDPRLLIGEESWEAMTEIAEVYELERKECVDAIQNYEWTASELQEAAIETSCKECGSSLLEPKNDQRRPDVECRSCGKVYFFEEFAEHAMAEWTNHDTIYLDGGKPEVVTCPNCSQETYHYGLGMCVSCEDSVAQECAVCSNSIPPDELEDDGMCGYCRHKFSCDD
jgi:hypothetical protein